MSQLQLNNEIIPFKEFYGRNHEQMHKLIEEGRVPLSVAGLMQARLDALNGSSEDVKNAWWNNYFDTGDGILYHPEGNMKIVLGGQVFRDMTSDSPLYSGALVLGDSKDASIEAYKSTEGVELRRSDLDGLVGQTLSKEAVKSHPVWNALVPNGALLNDYVDAVFELTGREKNMGIWTSSPQDKAVGRLWCVDYHKYDSDAFGNDYLDNCDGRLVGVAPEALGAREGAIPNPKNIAENVHSYLSSRSVSEGVTKKGLLQAVQSCYK